MMHPDIVARFDGRDGPSTVLIWTEKVGEIVNRRVFLKAVSASTVAGTAVLAGCSGGTGNANNASGANSSGSNTSASSTGGTGEGTTAGGGGESGQNTTATSTGTNASTTGAGNTSATGTGTRPGNSTSGGSGGNESGTTTVGMYTEGGNYYFDPIGLSVEKGTTVTFEIKKGDHSSTAYKKGNDPAKVTRIPNGAKAWDSGIISEGETFDHTFDTEGTYDYFCIPHKTLGMVGRIVVGSPGGPAEGSMPPDGKVPESKEIVKKGSISYSDFS